jgi:thiamine pyrophosphate-dependent acetolactate synthase large subunit-like protein
LTTLADLLGRALAADGVDRAVCPPVAGYSLPGIRKVVEGNPVLARLIADADGRVGPRPGVALLEGPRLRVSSLVGGPAQEVTVPAGQLARHVQTAFRVAGGLRPAAVELALDRPLDAEADDASSDASPAGRALEAAPPVPDVPARARTVVLAGPGVVRAGPDAVAGLRALAARAGLAVANTWGAKGLFEWDSPHHMSTVGLQERDFELLGFGDADLLITTGVDPAESPPERYGLAAETIDVDPRSLGALARAWRHAPAEIRPNDFLERMSAVCQPLFVDDRFPLSPARAVADVRSTMVPGDVVAADPGPAGLWVARSFSTTTLGSVVVPATVAEGFAAAAAIACGTRRPRVPAVAITAAPLDRETRVALDTARRIDCPLVLEVWGDGPVDGAVEVTSAAHHLEALAAARARRGVTLLHVPVDFGDTQRLVDVAGPVVAWPELALG